MGEAWRRARVACTMALSGVLLAAVFVGVSSAPAGAALGDTLDPSWSVTNAGGATDQSIQVQALAKDDANNTVYVGGNFTQIGPERSPNSPVPAGKGIDQPYLFAIDGTSGAPKWGFGPRLDGAVRALAFVGGILYVGGDFTHVNGVALGHFAMLDPATGAPAAGVTQLPADGQVSTLWYHGASGRLYVGGQFTKLGTQNRGQAARITLPAGTLDAWRIQLTGRVLAFTADPAAASPSDVFVGGEFQQAGGASSANPASHQFLAQFSAAEPAPGQNAPIVDSWLPAMPPYDPSQSVTIPRVRSLDYNGGRIFVGAGGNGGFFFVFDASTAAELITNTIHTGGGTVHGFQLDSDVQEVKVVGNEVLIGGHFSKFWSGQNLANQCELAAFDRVDPNTLLAAPNVIDGAHYGPFTLLAEDTNADGTPDDTWWGGQLTNLLPSGSTACGTGSQGPWGGLLHLRDPGGSSDTTRPSTPAAPQVSGLSSTSAQVSWAAASDASGISAYYVYRDNAFAALVPGTATSATITGLTAGTTYQFKVRAFDNFGNKSTFSAITEFTPGNRLPSPLNAFGLYFPVAPKRVLDTRPTSAIGGVPTLTAGQDATVTVAGVAGSGVPASGVQLVAMNVTVLNPSAPGYLTVFPADGAAPVVSNLNFVAHQTVPNLVVARVSASGQVKLKLSGGRADVIIDVVGWYGSDATTALGSRLATQVPKRVLDTRATSRIGPYATLGPKATIAVQVVPPGSGVTGVVVNLTAVAPTAYGYVTAYPGDQATRPNASNLNLAPGQTRPNLAMVKVPTSGPAAGQIKIYNSGGKTDVLVDLMGTYSGTTALDDVTTGRVIALSTPTRVLDTRQLPGKPGTGTRVWSLAGVTGTVPTSVSGVIANATATAATGPTYLTLYPTDTTTATPPRTSNLNVTANQTVPNLVVVPITAHGNLGVYNAAGSIHYIIDVSALVLG